MKHVWQTIAGVLASALLTGAGCWMVFGQDTVSRAEMFNYVQAQSPWIIDRGAIQAGQRNNTENIGKMLTAQQELIVEQRVLVTQVQLLLDRNN